MRLSTSTTSEKGVEKMLTEGVKKMGGICWKWVSPGRAGVPDRIVVVASHVWFVELKSEGKVERPLQVAVRKMIEAAGGRCRVLAGGGQVREFLDEVARLSATGR